MLFQRTNRSDPERVFIVVLSNEAQAADDTVQWELTAASIDGVKVRQPDTANEWAFVGIADAAIASGSYGLVQIYGYRSTSRLFQTNTSINTGVPLVPVAAVAYMASISSLTTSSSDVTLQPVFAVLGESIVSSSASATVSRKIFLRAM